MPIRLTIGRVGLDVDFDDPEAFSGTAGPGGRSITLSGTALGATLAETKALRDELVALAALPGGAVPITWDGDPTIDGYYRIVSANFDVRALHDRGFIPFSMTAEREGSDGERLWRSKIVGTVLGNDHGVTEAEAAPFHAPPRGSYGYNPGATIPSFVTRTGSDGAVRVYRDVSLAADPFWSVAAASFYSGAGTVRVSGVDLAGIAAPNTPNDWRLSNELVRVSPNGTGGRLDVAHHDGTQWEPAKVWRIQVGGTDVGQWDAVAVLRNDAEAVAVRLTRDVSAGGELTLDLLLRRGSRFVVGLLTRHAAATLKVVLATAEVGEAITPTGASSAVAIQRTTNDSDGNRYVVGSARSFTNDLTTGGLSKASTTTLGFFLGSEIGGSGAAAGDDTGDLALQYLGNVTEHVIGMAR